jgi:biotin operon repressor
MPYAERTPSSIRVATSPKGYEEHHQPRYTVTQVARLLPRLRCGACRGRLQIEPPPGRLYCPDCAREYAEIVDTLPTRLPLSGVDARPRRGRPPKSITEQKGEAGLCTECNVRRPKYQRRRCGPCTEVRGSHLCPDCQAQMVSSPRRVRCSPCAVRHRWSTSPAGRLLALLADGRWHGRDDLYDVLAISNQQLRTAIRRARAYGYAIKLVESGYRLEGVA